MMVLTVHGCSVSGVCRGGGRMRCMLYRQGQVGVDGGGRMKEVLEVHAGMWEVLGLVSAYPRPHHLVMLVSTSSET